MREASLHEGTATCKAGFPHSHREDGTPEGAGQGGCVSRAPGPEPGGGGEAAASGSPKRAGERPALQGFVCPEAAAP